MLVEFDQLPPGRLFDAYFQLKEGLERILGTPVDVISAGGIENPYFRARAFDQREPLYAA